jgi:YVTN family beta-propeller protein
MAGDIRGDMARLLLLLLTILPGYGGERIFVAHKWADSAGFYDAATGKPLAVIPVGRKPHEFAVTPDFRLAYVTNYGVDLYTEDLPGGNTLSIVDLAKQKTLGEISLGEFRRPHGIERGASGRLYVTCDRPPSLVVVDPEARKVIRSIGTQALPHMVAVAEREDKAWTVNSGAGTVSVIDLRAGKAVRHIKIGGVPMGVALAPGERTLYAVNRTGNTLSVIDTRTDEVVDSINIPGSPVRLVITPDRKHMLVSLTEAGEVAVVSLAGNKVVRRFHVGQRVEGITVDPKGRHGYASAQADNKVVKFSLEDWKVVLEIPTRERPDPLVVLP